MATFQPLKIIIVGGSIAGLTNGLALKRAGHIVHIFERTPQALLHDQGAGIVAGGHTQNFFSKYDKTRTSLAVTSPYRHYLDKEGNEIWRQDHEQKMTSWDLLYNVLRANFDGVETEYVKKIPSIEKEEGQGFYEYGRKVLDFEVKEKKGQADAVTVFFEDTRDGKNSEKGKIGGDILLAADGPSSTIRHKLQPEVERTYCGYVALRGTIPENELDESTKKMLVETFTFFHTEGIQILSYIIPGKNGTLKAGERLLNWVWYRNYPQDSPSFNTLMTDKNGTKHDLTLPVGLISPAVWSQQQRDAEEILPPQFARLFQRTKHPFVQAITDVNSSKAVFHGGKVILVGDALCAFRPHTAAATGQACYHGMELGEVFGKGGNGFHGLEDWEERMLEYARETSKAGREIGDASQFGKGKLRDDTGSK